MSNIIIRYLGFFGAGENPASLSFTPGLNIICGASETGKSFVAESIDFMLGRERPVRDIPECAGYDRVRLAIESNGYPPLTLDRSIEGGDYRAYEELISDKPSSMEAHTLRWKHAATRTDTLSYELLNRIGYAGKVLRKNASGKTRTLSFRDLARLCVVTEEGIQRRGSPILSGQFVTATSDYAAFKLMITGNDDSAFVQSIADSSGSEREDGKIELLDQMIAELQAELDETGVDERELRDQEERLNTSLQNQVTLLQSAQLKFNELISDRSELAISLRGHKSRLIEISELINRFYLLDRHYDTDVQRLHAIRESGTLFVNFSAKACPLCGAKPADQHLNSECDGNAEAVVKAAEAEILKIEQLRRELEETITSLRAEFVDIEFMMPLIQARYDDIELQLTQFVAPNLTGERASYNELMNQMTNVRFSSEKIIRLKGLIERRTNLELTGDGVFIAKEKTATRVSKSILDEFAQEVQDILQKWDYPYASRVFFDESTKDIQISGKDRGSTGKGLRAITHAAFTIGLMQFCKERDMPHPGFVVLDSPLLAYWKPEGDDDDLRGTSLKESFYKYLLSISKDQQVIIIENEHPPDFVEKGANVAVFTKNPSVGRYGFFPFP